MARVKKFNGYIGFLWNTEGIAWVGEFARQRELNPSDICRAAMNMYRAVQEGQAVLTYPVNPALAATGISNEGNTGIMQHPANEAPKPDTVDLSGKNN